MHTVLGVEITDEEFDELFYQQSIGKELKVVDGKLVAVDPYSEEQKHNMLLDELRFKRELECFSVINQNYIIDGKSATWFDTLTEEQRREADIWIQAWRDVTKTLVIPDKPDWLK